MNTPADVKKQIQDAMYFFNTGVNYTSYEFLGAKKSIENNVEGYRFTVWAPRANNVEIAGTFSNWQPISMDKIGETGAWSVFVSDAKQWDLYKYIIEDRAGHKKEKQDPFALAYEVPPKDASVIQDIPNKEWTDDLWWENKRKSNQYESPMNIYEVHAGSWKRHPNGDSYSFTELKEGLIPYVKKMGYTHIEFMPLMDHPLEASWGYQVTGFFSIAGRFGHDILPFMDFVEEAHNQGIGVILDWVPAHFCRNDYALAYYDGTPTYEYEDDARANNVGWGTLNFDLGKPQVQSFLISNAVYWLETFHIDGLRIDAVSNMLYNIDPHAHGTKSDNYEGITFLRKLNREIFLRFPDVMMIAEEGTAWPLVSRPIESGGLGFNYKWNMGWMNDTLRFFEMDPLFRKDNFNLITFSFMYAFNENFILPISHDEVVHGKKSMLEKMRNPSGNRYRQFAHLRTFYGFMLTHPGKKLNFMGNEIGHFLEWREYEQLEWSVLKYDYNTEFQHYIAVLNNLYKNNKALYELDFSPNGIVILDADNCEDTILTYIRRGKEVLDFLVVIVNFTPVERKGFRVGVPFEGTYDTLLNSENLEFGGTWTHDQMNIKTEKVSKDGQSFSLEIIVPALSVTILKPKAIKGTCID